MYPIRPYSNYDYYCPYPYLNPYLRRHWKYWDDHCRRDYGYYDRGYGHGYSDYYLYGRGRWY